jgi:hypothetical protein
MTIRSQKLLNLAWMFLGGLPADEMAKRTGWRRSTVMQHLKSELFQAQVEELRRAVKSDNIADVIGRLDREALASTQLLADFRDDATLSADREPHAGKRMRMDAARYLLGEARQWKSTRLGSADPDSGGLKLRVSEDTLREMFTVLAEYRGKGITATVMPETILTVSPEAPPLVNDALLEDMQDAERDAVADA